MSRIQQDEINKEVRWGTLREFPAALAVATKLYPGSSVLRFKNFSTVDWAVLVGNEIVAGLEVKTRRFGREAFPSTILPLEKYHAGRYTRRFFDMPTFAVIVFTDGLATIDLGLTPDKIEEVTRRNEQAVPHVFYGHERLDWHDDLWETVQAEVQVLVNAAGKK